MASNKAQQLIVKSQDFEASKVIISEAANSSKYNAKRMDISYGTKGRPLLVQTPAFKSAKLRMFPKSKEGENDALVVYFTFLYQDEDAFRQLVVEGMSNKVIDHVKANARALFDKKNLTESNIMANYSNPVNEPVDYPASFRTTIILNEDKQPVNCEFYDKDGKKLDYTTFSERLNGKGESVRAILGFTHCYMLATKKYGFKSCVRVLQLVEKDAPDEELLESANKTSAGGDTHRGELGLCFL